MQVGAQIVALKETGTYGHSAPPFCVTSSVQQMKELVLFDLLWTLFPMHTAVHNPVVEQMIY